MRRFNISDESECGGKRRKEIQKPWVFDGVLSPISFAAERNGAPGGIEPSAAGGGCSEVSEWQILGTATVTVTRAEHGTPRSIPRPYFSPSTLSRQNRRTGSYNTVPTNPATVMPYTSSVSHVRLYRSFR